MGGPRQRLVPLAPQPGHIVGLGHLDVGGGPAPVLAFRQEPLGILGSLFARDVTQLKPGGEDSPAGILPWTV